MVDTDIVSLPLYYSLLYLLIVAIVLDVINECLAMKRARFRFIVKS